MARLKIQLLGGFAIRVGPGQTLSLGTKKAQALVAYLAVPRGRAHPRDKLASLLWGDTGDEQARQSLRQTLVALRRALPATGPPILVVDRDTIGLDPGVVDVDVSAFERLAAGTTAKALTHAGALYQGELLAGIRVTEAPFEDWLAAERARLHALAIDSLNRLLQCQLAEGTPQAAVQTAHRLLALDPLQEVVHRALMRLYVTQGRRGTALRQYQICASALRQELSTEPEDETRRLYHDVLRRETRSAGIVEDGARSGRRVRAGAVHARVDLPVSDAPLLGRETELGQLQRLLDEAMQGRGRLWIHARAPCPN